ncbi:MAG: hypothetical protein QNK03_18690 [Myxococcota bacterium]|nr:hypothetical protein [Myxococcota bacterium]
MKTILGVLGALVLLFLLVAGITATPLVGEVVTLHTREGGEWKTTPLWIVDAEGVEYLRAGSAESGWLVRSRADPTVRLERAGGVVDVALVEAPDMRGEVNDRMAEKYGWADGFVGMMGDHAASLPLRVDRKP